MPDFKNTVGGRFLTMLEAQAPANFAMVMSTGIVSVALHLLDYPIGARLLFWLNAALCVGLFFPNVDFLLLFKLSPLVLVALGCEVIFAASTAKGMRLKYDFSPCSCVFC